MNKSIFPRQISSWGIYSIFCKIIKWSHSKTTALVGINLKFTYSSISWSIFIDACSSQQRKCECNIFKRQLCISESRVLYLWVSTRGRIPCIFSLFFFCIPVNVHEVLKLFFHVPKYFVRVNLYVYVFDCCATFGVHRFWSTYI